MFTSHHQLWPKKRHFPSHDFPQSLGTKWKTFWLLSSGKHTLGEVKVLGDTVGHQAMMRVHSAQPDSVRNYPKEILSSGMSEFIDLIGKWALQLLSRESTWTCQQSPLGHIDPSWRMYLGHSTCATGCIVWWAMPEEREVAELGLPLSAALGTSQQALGHLWRLSGTCWTLAQRLLRLGRAFGTWEVVCWCHQASQLELRLRPLLGHDQRQQIFDQTPENICFVCLCGWSSLGLRCPLWAKMQNGCLCATWAMPNMGKANLGDCIFPCLNPSVKTSFLPVYSKCKCSAYEGR